MLRLDTTTRSLEIVLGGAHTTNALPVVVSWSDKTSSTYSGGTTTTASNGTTAVTVCAAPAASTIRDIDSVNVHNADTVSATVTIRVNDNSTYRTVIKAILATGDQMYYSHGSSWVVVDPSGSIKYSLGGAIPITDDTTTNSTMYPVWVAAASGNQSVKVSSTKLSFNPSTGVLTATSFTGAGTGLTGTGASFTAGAVTNGFYTNTNQTLTAAKRCGQTALTSGTTVTPNFNDNNDFTLTIAHNATLANPTNLTAGQGGVIVITQDGTGGRIMAFGTYWKFESGTAPTLTITASAVDVLAYYVESSTRISAKLIKDVK